MSDGVGDLKMDTILIRNPNFVLRVEEDEGGILFDPDTGAVRLLNGPAAVFWNAVDGQLGISDVIDAVKSEFEDVDADADMQLQELAGKLYSVGAVGIRVES